MVSGDDANNIEGRHRSATNLRERKRRRAHLKLNGLAGTAGLWLAQVKVHMLRFARLSIVIVLSLLTTAAVAAPRHKKHALRPHNYGFLPGYQQPLNNAAPLFKQETHVLRNARRKPRHWYIGPTPHYYNWNGEWRYFGRPGFYRGRYNGGSFGPCWTQTPIGPVWTCG